MVLEITTEIYNVTTIGNHSTTTPSTKPVLRDDLKFLIVPLIVMLLVILLSALVYLMIRKNRSAIIRKTVLRLYEFDSNEQEWETPLLSDDSHSFTDYHTTSL